MKAFLLRFLKRAEISRAVFFSLLGKMWGTLSGPVTLALIALFFTADIQGYYYTFLSLLALQTFLELSFSSVIVNFASHEWSLLHLKEDGEIGGDPEALSRLAHLVRFSVRWYSVLAVLFVGGIGIGGYIFLWKKHDPTIIWQGPWWVLVVLVGIQLSLLPIQSTLDGCNQIARMAMIRMTASIIGTVAFWIGLFFRWGLWAACLTYGLNCLAQIILIWRYYGPFFRSLFRTAVVSRVSWTNEIFPLQWRLALGGVVNYFSTSIFTPVMFWYYGAKVAGQMGMGFQIMGAAQAIALTWVQVNIPLFGALISHKKFHELDRMFIRVTVISFGVLLLMCASAWGVVKIFFLMHHRFAERFMPLFPLSLFLLTAIFYHLPQCQSIYLRAHKREPLLVVSIVSSVVIGAAVWFFGRIYGLSGAGGAYLTVVALLILPWVSIIWIQCRKAWHVHAV